MISAALGQYPHLRFREGERRILNPVLRKTYAIRPEERVRMQIVEYFLRNAGISRNRMSFESPVKLKTDRGRSRTDLICYDEDLKPLLLCECKSTDVILDHKAALQIGRYNTKVASPFLLITNGIQDFWFEVHDGDIRTLNEVPEHFRSEKAPQREPSYWEERGFIKPDALYNSPSAYINVLNHFYSDPYQPVKYLRFEGMPDALGLEHYYAIRSVNEQEKVALSFSATEEDSRFNAVLNSNGQNVAYISVSLSDERCNALLESADGKKVKDLGPELGNLLTAEATENRLAPYLYNILASL